MTTLTRQDVQSVLESTFGRLQARSITRQDLQSVADANRDRIVGMMNGFMIQNQQLIQQTASRNAQMYQQIAAISSQIASLSNELRSIRQQMEKVAGQKTQKVIMPMPSESWQPQSILYGSM